MNRKIVDFESPELIEEERIKIENDSDLARQELRLCEQDFEYFCRRWIWIVNKNRRTQLLTFNRAQRLYHAQRTRFDIILKARKLGMTTYKCAEFFHETIFRPNTNSTIIAHNLDTTIEIFEKIKFFYENLPNFLRPKLKRNNQRALVLLETPQGRPLNSKYTVGTAGNYRFGRGKDIDNLHLSEYAFYQRPEKIKLGAMQALRDGGRICIESTANGFNDFHREWRDAREGLGRFRAHFFPWCIDPSLSQPIAEGERFQLTPAESKIMQAHRLTLAQMKWRRLRAAELREMFAQEYPINDVEAFLTSGRPVFDNQKLSELLVLLSDVQPLEIRENGTLKIWKRPVRGREYVAGADTSEGISGGDYSCMLVLDRETCEEVAQLRALMPPPVFARKIAGLAALYNHALLGVERNNHGHTVLDILKNRLGYPNLYYHREYNAATRIRKLGWETNLRTKPIMIDELAQALHEGAMAINDPEFISECLTYVYNDRGGTEAQTGCHDDRVIAAAIALQLRKCITPTTKFTYISGV